MSIIKPSDLGLKSVADDKKIAKNAKWIVQHFKGDGEHEISVVKEGTHGTESWGWSGDDKIILVHGDDEYSKKTRNMLLRYAELIAYELNS